MAQKARMTHSPSTDSPHPVPSHSIATRLLRVAPYFGQLRGTWLAVALATVVGAATEPMIPALLKPLLDRGFQQGQLPTWSIPVALLLLFGVRGLAGYLAQVGLARITQLGLLRLRQAMFDRVLQAELTLFSQQSSSSLSNTVEIGRAHV